MAFNRSTVRQKIVVNKAELATHASVVYRTGQLTFNQCNEGSNPFASTIYITERKLQCAL